MTIKQYLASPVMVIGTFNTIMCICGVISVTITIPLLLFPVVPAMIMMLYLNLTYMFNEYKTIEK